MLLLVALLSSAASAPDTLPAPDSAVTTSTAQVAPMAATTPAGPTWDQLRVGFDAGATPTLADALHERLAALADTQQALRSRAKAVQLSDGYYTRLKIHRIASYATLPLFAGALYTGTVLYNDKSAGVRTEGFVKSAHPVIAGSLAALFAVNTVTGLWNLIENKEPEGKTRRWVHGILMLVADGGFAATAALAPDDGFANQGKRDTHRAVALSSIGVATVAYLIMLIGN